MQLTEKIVGKRFSRAYHEGRLDARLAYSVRLTVMTVVLLLAFQFDGSDYLLQLSKWVRRAVILAGTLVSMELLYFVIIKITLCFFDRDSAAGRTE